VKCDNDQSRTLRSRIDRSGIVEEPCIASGKPMADWLPMYPS